MNSWNFYLGSLILNFILMFVFCWVSIIFSSKICANRITSTIKKIIVCVSGSLICTFILSNSTIEIFYMVIYICFIISYRVLLGSGEWNLIFFLTNAYLINIMSLRMIITCIIALCTNQNLAETAYSSCIPSEISIAFTLIALIIFLLIMIRLVPGDMVHRITNITELRRGMNIFMGLSNLYLLMQSTDYSYTDNIGFTLFRNLISICALLLIANWAFLIYNMKILKLLNIESENIQMHSEMAKLNIAATTDGLTGVSNKMTAIEIIDEELNNGGAFFMIDIDDFKTINDTLGHNTGDILLKKTSELIKSSFREDDIIGRFGGDEFIIFMKNHFITQSVVEKKAADLCKHAHTHLLTDSGKSITTSISIGVIIVPANKDLKFDEVFQFADTALYDSKEKGKNSYTIRTI